MKTIYLVLIISSGLIGAINGQAPQDLSSKSSVIKINPIGFANAEFQLAYEHYFNERLSSFSLVPSIILKENFEESKFGWQVETQYRFYLSHLNRETQNTFLGLYNYGFYAGFYASYFDYEEDYIRGQWDEIRNEYIQDEYHKEIKSIEGGAIIGVQVDVTTRIVLDFFVGGGIKSAEIKDSFADTVENPDYYEYYGVFDPEYKGVKPTLGMAVGITF